MTKVTISNKYNCTFAFKFNANYIFSQCGKCINFKTQRIIKRVVKGYTIGYILSGKFYSLDFLKANLIKLKTNDCPF